MRCCRSSQKNTPSQTTHCGWLLSRAAVISSKQHYIEILCKRMSWMMAQTIVRQLVSKVQHINLIGVLPNIAEETLNGIGRLDVSVHRLRKLVERQGLLFLFGQASHRFRIAFSIFGFEGCQLDHGFLFAGLLPNANEFG
jgi:hypothetical protein